MANLGGDGGVDGVAAFAEDFNAGVGGEVVDGDDHGVVGAGGLLVRSGSSTLPANIGLTSFRGSTRSPAINWPQFKPRCRTASILLSKR